MRLVPITRAVGHELARDIPVAHPGQVPLLRQGAVITERYRAHLAAKGIHAIWIHDELTADVTPAELVPEPVRHQAAARVHSALGEARNAFARSQGLPANVVRDLAAIADLLTANLANSPSAALALTDLADADAYTHRHSINVAALGLLLARECFREHGWIDYRGNRRYDRIDERMTQIGLGLLLHDIGKMAVPKEVLNKPGRLDPHEWSLMKEHPEAGVAMLRSADLSPLIVSVVRSHHERMDGSGYPSGLEGDRISQFARIAAVADVYDAITSSRPYRDAEPAATGVAIIRDGRDTAFDGEVVRVFSRIVFPHPVGTEIELPDGRIAVVIAVDPDTPFEPTVRVAGEDGPLEFTFTVGRPTPA